MDPSVREFKEFVKSHPKLVQEVRTGKTTWNGLYQDWVIIGGDDRHWHDYKETVDDPNPESVSSSSSSENAEQEDANLFNPNQTVASLMKSLGQMNISDLQNHLSQFSGVMGNVQQLMNQFQARPGSPRSDSHENPFSFRGF
nr:YlbD family protein [Geomicrobium halophilum]